MMSASRTTLGLLTMCALTACAAKSSDSTAAAAFTPQDSAAIAAEAEKWRATSLARDFDAFATTLTDDAVLYPPNVAPTVGKEASMAYIKAFPTITKFEVSPRETGGVGDMAFDRGDFTLTAKLPDGTEINDQGSFLSVFRRQADGSWKHSRVMWHSNLPVPTAAPATRTATKAPASKTP